MGDIVMTPEAIQQQDETWDDFLKEWLTFPPAIGPV
jgi:hypothetical protein